jgi:3D (Asp-Asp-Asp) domain-containing protein
MEVRIEHASTFTLHIGDTSRVFYTHQETLEAALAEVGLTFGPEDRVDPPLSVAVTDGMEARIVRVSGRPFYERQPVEHVTVFQPDTSLTGTETYRVEGSDGELVTEYRIRIEDGVEVEKTFVDQYYEPEPVDTVIYYAASALNSADFSPADHQVIQVLRMYGTWYNAASSGRPATHPDYGITRSGALLTKGIVAVDPNVIPLGTRLYIPGYGFAVALDTGGGIIGDRIDLGYPDGVAVDWYTGWTDVYILGP